VMSRVWCLQTFPGRDAEGDNEVDVGHMGGWHGAGPVDELDERGEPRKVGEGAVDAELLILSSSLRLPENPPAPLLLIVGVTVIGKGRSE
jgi:hypothetical protein